MKTGEAAKIMGIDGATVRNWIDHEDLNRFFSDGARGEHSPHRVLNEEDVLILNTIRHLRSDGIMEWQDIAEKLDSGHRVQEFPPNAISADPRLIPIPQAEQSARAAATLAERDSALAKVSELESYINELRKQIAQRETEINELRDKYIEDRLNDQRSFQEQRMADREEIGRLKMQVEMLQKQISELKKQSADDS